MKLTNQASYEMATEIALTDSELETVLGGCAPQPPCGGGSPSYDYSPSYGGGSPYSSGSPFGSSYGSPYGQSYGSPYGQSYGSPFDTGSGCGSSAPSYSVTTYTVVSPSNSGSPCNGGY